MQKNLERKMILLNPKKPKYDNLDEKSKQLMLKTIEFFEKKGKKKLKHDDHERVWYADFLEFQKQEKLFATMMTPEGYGEDARWDSNRICDFNEILGFYGLAYWYTWQVSMLGLGPIWLSKNEAMKQKAAKLLKEGEIFAFGLSEKEHGADLISSDMLLKPLGDGKYEAHGDKYYIGNGNKAAMVSTFGKFSDTGKFVFFVANSQHEKYECIKNVTNTQNYVSEYMLHNYPIPEGEILSKDREAWDNALATIAFCKYNLGWASIGISTHAFYEALNHAANRRLYNQYVTDFPHIKQLFVDAYTKLVAMKLFTRRAADYIRVSSETDRRYLLYNPMVKMKVTMQGEEVINLIWDVIAAKGFEKDMYFETAARDIRGLPKLEGTAHVNMVLINNFMESYLFKPSDQYKEIGKITSLTNDSFIFNQGSTTKGLKNIPIHSYEKTYASKDLPNIKVFREQIELFKHFLKDSPISKPQSRDLDYMLTLGEIFTLMPYGQLIIENAKIEGIPDAVLDQIFDFMVRDLSKYATQLYLKTSNTEAQMANCLKLIKRPVVDEERYNKVWQEVYSYKDVYEMNP
jgi:acyl-CoA dehydrogenase